MGSGSPCYCPNNIWWLTIIPLSDLADNAYVLLIRSNVCADIVETLNLRSSRYSLMQSQQPIARSIRRFQSYFDFLDRFLQLRHIPRNNNNIRSFCAQLLSHAKTHPL